MLEKPKSLIYTGIGSRTLPTGVVYNITAIARKLALEGFILRSGAAAGSDAAFEMGCMQSRGKKEIYLPSKGFNKNSSLLYEPSELAFKIAEKYHPAWSRLDPYTKRLMARNVHQVLGQDCKTPTDLVICWTKDGATKTTTRETGGTGQAIRIAADLNIPVFNLCNSNSFDEINHYVETLLKERQDDAS